MTSNEQNDKQDFKVLVARCAGPDRKGQETYLLRLVAKLLIDRFGRDPGFPDKNILQFLIDKGLVNEMLEKDIFAAMKVLDSFYGMIASVLLDDPDFEMLDIRSKAMEFMQEDLRQRRTAQQETNI